MDLNKESLILVLSCVCHKLKHLIVLLTHYCLTLLILVTKCLKLTNLTFQSFSATIKASPVLSSVALCCFIVTFPLFFLLLGLAISSHLSPNTYIFPSKDVVVDPSGLNYTFFNTQNLSIVMAGRLGNRMFQYAALYGIAKANGFKAVLQKDGLLTEAFAALTCTLESDSGQLERLSARSLVFVERRSNAFDAHAFMLNFERPITLVGFYQSWRYFDHVRSDVRRQFVSFRGAQVVDEFVQKMLSQLQDVLPGSGEVVRVGVHVRRGDFVGAGEQGYSSPDKYYFRRAMQVFTKKKKTERVVFVVCSDDMAWVRSNFKNTTHPIIMSPFSSPHHDLKLLATCHHSIISGGSFGWWAAWLADGTTIYPSSFPTSNSPLASQFKRSDYFLPQWISL